MITVTVSPQKRTLFGTVEDGGAARRVCSRARRCAVTVRYIPSLAHISMENSSLDSGYVWGSRLEALGHSPTQTCRRESISREPPREQSVLNMLFGNILCNIRPFTRVNLPGYSCRPQNDAEKSRGEPVIVSCSKNRVQVQSSVGKGAVGGVNLTKNYSYDRVRAGCDDLL